MPKLAIIIIAAGNSSRLGQPKQLVRFNGQALIKQIADLARHVTDDVSCVLGFQAEKIAAELKPGKLKCLFNSEWHLGMGSSIACGVKHLQQSVEGVMILLCDQWALNLSDIQLLVTCWQSAPDKIVCSRYPNKNQQWVLGAPSIFPRCYFSPLQQLQQQGARALLMNSYKHQPDKIVVIDINDAAFDLDTPSDLQILRATQ